MKVPLESIHKWITVKGRFTLIKYQFYALIHIYTRKFHISDISSSTRSYREIQKRREGVCGGELERCGCVLVSGAEEVYESLKCSKTVSF